MYSCVVYPIALRILSRLKESPLRYDGLCVFRMTLKLEYFSNGHRGVRHY